MRARVKRRQRNRRILIVLAAVALIAVFAVSAYYLSLPSSLDAYDNKSVSLAQMSALNAAASPPYGSGGSTLSSEIRNLTGQALTSNGKPVVLYVGEEGCPYCAEYRWALVLALMRFGTFTNLAYMTSSLDGTDYPTFTFHGSTYQSNYIVFAPYELTDRGSNSLDTLPTNYLSIFNTYSIGGGVPFADYGGKYYTPGALLPSGYTTNNLNPLFGSENWTQVIGSINNGDALGSLIKAGANVVTATLCKLTGGLPSSVCQQSPIGQLGPVPQPLPGPSLTTNMQLATSEKTSHTR